MKVLHITNNFPTKNYPVFGIFVEEQIKSLTELGLKNEVFFINGREFGRKEYIASIIRLRKKLRNGGYDILHCHHAFSAIILFLTFRFFGFKKILSYQNPPRHEGGCVLYFLVKLLFHKIIIKSKFESINPSSKIFYLPNGVDLNLFKPKDLHESFKKLNLMPSKNYILFLDSYKRRSQKRLDRFNKVIEILTKNGNAYNIEPLVLFNAKRDLVPYYMTVSALHLLTSDFEGSPNSVKECLACNCPVVSTPVGNVQDLIGDVDGCYVSDSFDPNELAGLVLECIGNSDFEGRKKLLSKELDLNSVALRLLRVYSLMMKNEKQTS